MDIFCVGCGRQLDSTSVSCPECGTPARGAKFSEWVTLRDNRTFRAPHLCCCCLKESQLIKRHKIRWKDNTGKKCVVVIQIPWCRKCQFHRELFVVALGFSAVLAMYGGLFAASPFFHATGAMVLVVIITLFLAWGLGFAFIRWALENHFPLFRLPGHVRCCDAIARLGDDLDEAEVELVLRRITSKKDAGDQKPLGPITNGPREGSVKFGNRAFAQKWRQLNGPSKGEIS